ncbi:MAG: hypothetical protein GY832_36385 [Chloroflexi bacterium]|nr:hypothetical protein [Chloroflexota bacterium]
MHRFYDRIGVPLRLLTILVMVSAIISLAGCDGDEPVDDAEHGPVLQTGGTRERAPEIQNDPGVVSPPILHEPLLRCGTAVRVSGFAPGAIIRILEGGSNVIGDDIGFDPDGQMIALDVQLEDDWLITAVQEIDASTSDPSNEAEVRDHTEEYPSGLPRPEINALPLYRCGIATVVSNLPEGGELKVFSDARTDPIGWGSGVRSSHSVGINPPFKVGHGITAIGSICEIESPRSIPPRIVETEPSSLPAPSVPELYEDGTIIIVGNLVNGSKVTIRDQTTGDVVSGGGAPAGRVRFRASPPVSAGHVLEVEQQLCDVTSPPTIVTVSDCSDLPPPTLIGPQPGDTQVYLTGVVPGSRVLIYAGGDEIGDGGGSVIQLTRPVEAGETLIVVQLVGNCQSDDGYVVTVGTGLNDPGTPGQCQVESFRYGESNPVTVDITDFFNSPSWSVTVPMSAVPLSGIVYHPVGSGRYPLFMVVHGNSSPANAGVDGYNYLLEHLASHCIVAVSIDEHFLNGGVSGEMDARAIVMLRHLQLMREWDRDPTHTLFTKIAHGNVMVAGHSRGGEAAVVAEKFNQWLHDPTDADFDFGFGIRSIYAIAPVDGQIAGDASAPLSGLPLGNMSVNSADYFVIHGSHDGDVATFAGHSTFDRAFPVTSSAANLKALRFVHGANHKQFNTFWNTLTPDHPPTAPGADVQNLNKLNLTAYAFATLKGWLPYRAFLKREVTFSSLPAGMTVVRQYQDPERTFINHYEEDDSTTTASLSGVDNATSGSITDDDDINFDAPGPPHWLWQQTDGLLLGWSATDAVLRVKLDGTLHRLTTDYPVLSFRIGQVFDQTGSINPSGVDKDLTVRVSVGGVMGPAVRVSDYVRLVDAVHVTGTWTDSSFGYAATKTVMSTVRLPWEHLLPPELNFDDDWEIHFELDRHSAGLVVIDEIQASE